MRKSILLLPAVLAALAVAGFSPLPAAGQESIVLSFTDYHSYIRGVKITSRMTEYGPAPQAELPARRAVINEHSCVFRFRSYATELEPGRAAEPPIYGVGVIFEVADIPLRVFELGDEQGNRYAIPRYRFETTPLVGHSYDIGGMVGTAMALQERSQGCARMLQVPRSVYLETEQVSPTAVNITTLVIVGDVIPGSEVILPPLVPLTPPTPEPPGRG